VTIEQTGTIEELFAAQTPWPGLELAGDDDALFDVDGTTVIPTELCGGPWSPDAQHGSAVAAILPRTVETVSTPVPMRPTRFTVDLLSPVPLAPMTAAARVVKAGKRIAVIDAELRTDDRVAARASALLMRDGVEYPMPTGPPAPEPVARPPLVPEPSAQQDFADWDPDDAEFAPPGFARAMNYVRTRGTFSSGVPASAWMALRTRVVRDEPVTPFQLVATASDMGSGLGGFLDYAEWRTINADISLHLLRLPDGPHIGLDGEWRADPGGMGMSAAALFDHRGLVGRMVSSTFVDRWGDA